ncbi:MAG: M48 family metalloprotease [Pseudomonadota bacterium]
MRKRTIPVVAAILAAGVIALPAAAQQRISFVRDAEIENTIRAYATPLFTAAGLDPAAIRVHLVNDRSLNAFVANGLNMFINTGLLIRTESAEQVIGVIAHETGHIVGGHLARLRESMRGAMAESIVALVVGAATAVATGRPDAGVAVAAGGLQMAERGALRYTREMESSADQAALTLLDRSGQSARGLQEFLEIIADQELLAAGRQDPYVRTHPIGRERVESVRAHVANSPLAAAPPRPDFAEKHRRMRAKLLAYLDPARALQVYKETDTGLEARYARAIATSRRPDYPAALALVDQLIAERPDDGFFLDTKGQMLFEAGRIAESLPLYQRAAKLLPGEPLILTALAQVQIEANSTELTKAAIANLEAARRLDPSHGEMWRLLAVAYGRDDQLGMSALAQAERAALHGRGAEARSFAERAERLLPVGSPGWLRAQDIRQSSQKRE